MSDAMRSIRIFAILLGCLGLGDAVLATASRAELLKTDPSRPIIAQVVADPKKYVGHRIEIYGLVTESDKSAGTFMLQDVSQRPLLINGSKLPAVAAGDQVEVAGIVRKKGKDLRLDAVSLKHVKVIAGGGCC